MPEIVFYFGCWDRPGHYTFTPDGRNVWRQNRTDHGPWLPEDIDCKMQVGCTPDLKPGMGAYLKDQPERVGRLHHQDGWTALSFWDRTQDPRGGCNSTFIAEGIHDEAAMLALAAQHFPTIVARMGLEVPRA